MNIYFGHTAFKSGETKLNVDELYLKELIKTEPEILRKAGMEQNAILGPGETAFSLLTDVLEEITHHGMEFDAVYYDSAIMKNQYMDDEKNISDQTHEKRDLHDLLQFVGLKASRKINLKNIKYYGITQQSCTGLFTLAEIASAMLISKKDATNYICVTSDSVPPEYLYDRTKLHILLTDCASGFIVSKNPLDYLLVASENLSYTDTDYSQLKQLSFVTGTIKKSLEKNNINPDEIENVFIQNCWPDFWKAVIMNVFKDPSLFIQDEMKTYGHAFSNDLIINLKKRESEGKISEGKLQLGIGYGYGFHCSCILFKKM